MAGKKQPCIADGVSLFRDVMNRCGISSFKYVNNMIHAVNEKGVSMLIIPDHSLWVAIMEDKELAELFTELDITSPDGKMTQEKFVYAQELDGENWIEINGETMYTGEMVNVTIDEFQYTIPVNKGLFPLKLKKAEFNNFAYRLFRTPKLVLALKKKFDGPVDDSSFTIIRLFQIL